MDGSRGGALLAGMAVFSVGKPSPIGMFKELRAANAAVKHHCDHGAAALIIDAMRESAGSEQVQSEMQTKVKSLSKEKMRTSSLEGLRAASSSIAHLSPDEADGVIGWIVAVGRATAEAASDRGEKAKVSDAEAGMLRTIEATLGGIG